MSVTTTMQAERIDGPTPNGGAYALAYYRRDGKPAAKADADSVEVVEHGADGEVLKRTYGHLPPPPAV